MLMVFNKFSNHELNVLRSLIITDNKDFNKVHDHVHKKNCISGVYYVKVPKNSGYL